MSAVSKPIPRSGSSKVEVSPSVAEPAPPPAKPAGAPMGLLVGLAAVVVLVIGGGVVFKLTRPAPEPPAPIAKPPPTTPKVDTPTTPAAPAKVTLTLQTKPPGAEVLEDGVVIGKTPLTAAFEQGATRTLTFRLADYKDLERSLRPETDQALEFPLERVAPRPTPTKKPPRKQDDDIGAFE